MTATTTDGAAEHTPVGCSTSQPHGQVAQLVEQGTENPRVGGSIPSLATTFSLCVALFLSGCGGDRCEVLCREVAARLKQCKPESLSWTDLGAHNRTDFVNECRQQWERGRLDLSASDLRLSLDACADTNREIELFTCEEIVALYADIP